MTIPKLSKTTELIAIKRVLLKEMTSPQIAVPTLSPIFATLIKSPLVKSFALGKGWLSESPTY